MLVKQHFKKNLCLFSVTQTFSVPKPQQKQIFFVEFQKNCLFAKKRKLRKMQTSVEEIENLLLKSKVEKAIDLLLKSTKSENLDDLHDDVFMQSSAFYANEEKRIEQSISLVDYNLQDQIIKRNLRNILRLYQKHRQVIENDLLRRAELEKTDLQKQISTLTAKLTKTQADSSKNQEIQTLQAKIGKLESQINALNAEKEGFAKKLGELNRNLETERLEKRNLLEKIKILEGQKNIFTDQIFDIQGIKFKMIFVKGGTFMMGDNEWENTKPIHEVSLDSFWIAQTQCTQELWQAVMGDNKSHFKGAKLPVEMVSWNNCQEFIKKLNVLTKKTFSLPSEAQWEYAARGGNQSKGYKFAGSDNIEEVAWYKDNSENKTHEVGTLNANELLIYDMSGNVWEWCLDYYDENFYKTKTQINNSYNNKKNERIVLRGGSWHSNSNSRVAYRGSGDPSGRNGRIGFRLVLGL
ncbi:MAG: hypothetical protein EAZ97_11330 [Bacteroidetes bacterium]|nr:MAG: hypothetical protein EAZ97_11330 [Bacteroidota bacterium]